MRNLVNAGVPERVAMTITGHKSRAVFDRYLLSRPDGVRLTADEQYYRHVAGAGRVTLLREYR